MALFVGTTGTLVHVPELKARLATERRSQLVLEALRRGSFAPFGAYASQEKLTSALLDFFCQAAMNMQDPGLIRMLLHRGEAKDKLTAFVLAQRHARAAAPQVYIPLSQGISRVAAR
jgi:hypothetical protein